jgi:hypothetical protein
MSKRPRAAAALLGAVLAAAIGPTLAAGADDAVYLKSYSGAPPRKLAGTIVDYTGRELRLETTTGRPRAISCRPMRTFSCKGWLNKKVC